MSRRGLSHPKHHASDLTPSGQPPGSTHKQGTSQQPDQFAKHPVRSIERGLKHKGRY